MLAAALTVVVVARQSEEFENHRQQQQPGHVLCGRPPVTTILAAKSERVTWEFTFGALCKKIGSRIFVEEVVDLLEEFLCVRGRDREVYSTRILKK